MSIFASRRQKTLEVPNDPGQTITIKALPRRHLEASARASQLDSLEQLKQFGDLLEMQKAIEAIRTPDDKAPDQAPVDRAGESEESALPDPLNNYDRHTLIKPAVVAWSYPEEITDDTLADLDEDTEEWLAREVLRLSKPSLFETEADRKNG